MLIDATHQQEEIRVATVLGQRLEDLDIEHPNRDQKKSNIYLGIISRVEPSLEAVFVNYGANRHGFLPLKEIESSYFLTSTDDPRSDIKKILKEGQELLIQVEKEERGNKGAALTTYISLAGCYLVLMPNNAKAGGISRRIEGEDREQMKQILSSLNIPNNMGVIVRTAGLGKNISELQWDFDVLLHHWNAIKNAAGSLQAPCLLHQESNIIIRAIRDNLRSDIGEILINNKDVYEQAKQYMELLRTDSKKIVKHYTNSIPLFTKFKIETQIEDAYQHEIRLPSGGSIVFDRTEALTAIDINSAQSTKGQDIEATALNTNLEAATEIARQLRLRDVGGLIVIDFIDMSVIKNQREVENRLREVLQVDRARIQLGRISRFGLLEMSRQRLKTSLGETTQIVCSKCSGKGSLRTVESLALSLIRIIEEEALISNTAEVQAQLPIELCTFLINEKRDNIAKIEQSYGVKVVTLPNPHYDFPNYKITRVKKDDVKEGDEHKSYQHIEEPQAQKYISPGKSSGQDSEVAAVQHISLHNKSQLRPSKPSLLKRLWTSLFESDDKETEDKSKHGGQKGNRQDRRSTKHRSNKTNKSTRNKPQDNKKPKQRRQKNNEDKKNTKVKFTVRDESDNITSKNISDRTESNNGDTATEIFFSHEEKNIRENSSAGRNSKSGNKRNKDFKQADNNRNKPSANDNIRRTKESRVQLVEKISSKPVVSDTNSTVDSKAELVNKEVFVKYDATTKIKQHEKLTKKRFYPKKKLPYEIDNSFENISYDINNDLPLQADSTIPTNNETELSNSNSNNLDGQNSAHLENEQEDKNIHNHNSNTAVMPNVESDQVNDNDTAEYIIKPQDHESYEHNEIKENSNQHDYEENRK